MSTLFFYTRNQFFNFKAVQEAAGFKVISMSKLLSSSRIAELDEYQQYYVDVSSLVSFVKTNDSQTLNFEQLIDSFGENVWFICDKAYEKDIKYLFRYAFDSFSDVEAECDETVDEEGPDSHLESRATPHREKCQIPPSVI